MSKLIKAIRIREDRAEILREKAIELTIIKKEHITEANLVNFLIDAVTERIKIDKNGLYIEDEGEDDTTINKMKEHNSVAQFRRKEDLKQGANFA